MGMYKCGRCGKSEASPFIYRQMNGRLCGPICSECDEIINRRQRLLKQMRIEKAPPLDETGL